MSDFEFGRSFLRLGVNIWRPGCLFETLCLLDSSKCVCVFLLLQTDDPHV